MRMNRYVCVDLETTGRDRDLNEIIELGAVRIENGRITETYQTLIKPKQRIPKFIFHLTGIDPQRIKEAPSFESVADEIRNFIGDDIFKYIYAIFSIFYGNTVYLP